MTSQEYGEWVQQHADLFSLCDPRDAGMFAAWAPLLIEFEFVELRSASYAIAQDSSGKAGFRANHPAMLQEVVHSRRAEAAARQRDRQEAAFASAACPDCYGVGLVRVPDPRFIAHGVLTRPYFVATACPCPVGVAKLNAVNARLAERKDDHRLTALADFEASVPDWRHIATAYEEKQQAEREAVAAAAGADKAAPIDVAAVAERMGRS